MYAENVGLEDMRKARKMASLKQRYNVLLPAENDKAVNAFSFAPYKTQIFYAFISNNLFFLVNSGKSMFIYLAATFWPAYLSFPHRFRVDIGLGLSHHGFPAS